MKTHRLLLTALLVWAMAACSAGLQQHERVN
jgi:hypothetical protein